MSSQSEEILLLERVLLRLGNADTDEKLQSAVGRFLAPVILKMDTNHEQVRVKVFEVLSHISIRVKARPQIQIPVGALIEQYTGATQSPYMQNFDLLFINIGFPRLPLAERAVLIPKLLSMDANNVNLQMRMTVLLLPILNDFKLPEDIDERKNMFELNDKPVIKQQFLQTLQDVLLLPYGVTPEQDEPAGVSAGNFKELMKFTWKAEDLETYKKGIVRLLCAGIFTDLEVFPLLVVASADTRFSVATPAIAEVGKISTTIDFSDAKVTTPLFLLFTGNATNSNVQPEKAQTPTCARVRQKLLVYLLRCRGRGVNPPKGLQVMFEGLFGENTNQKCKVLALQFADILIKESPKIFIEKISKVLLTGIAKVCGRECEEPNDVQNAAYVALAQLARVCPTIVRDDLKLILLGFNHLANAPPDLHTSIRDALVSMAEAFAWNKEHNVQESAKKNQIDVQLSSEQNLLLAMLSDNAESKLHVVQNAASVFLTTCYPQFYAPTRYLLLLIAGERNSLRENVTTYLYGVSKKDQINSQYLRSIEHCEDDNDDEKKMLGEQRHVIFPAFKTIMRHVHEMVQKRFDKGHTVITVGRTKLPFSLEIYEEIIDYLRTCLWFSAGAKCLPGDEKGLHLVRQFILMNYRTNDEENALHMYLTFVQRAIEAKRIEPALLAMYDLINAAPELLASTQMHLLEPLSYSLKDVSEIMRTNVAQLYGVLLAYGSDDNNFNQAISELLNNYAQKTLEHKHGWLLVLGHALSKKLDYITKTRGHEKVNYEGWAEFVESIKLIAKMLCENQWLLVSAGVKCISMIGKHVIIPKVEVSIQVPKDNDTEDTEMEEYTTAKTCTKLIIFGVVYNLLRSTSVRSKIREEAAKCLGNLAIGDGNYFTNRILEKFLLLVKVQKDTTLNIAISEAIASILCGYDVNVGAPDGVENFYNKHCSDVDFENFLTSLIRLVTEPNPHCRQSCAVWLLSVVKHCSKRPSIVQKRQILQFAFTELLSDDSEFVQDVASRGLGLVYSLSDGESQNDLANDLLDQLIGTKKKVKKVAENTELFAEGMLGKTPTGGNITTYKELCSLASDLNKPEMIYQFMQLANHNAAWTSKLGAAFGLKSLSKDSKAKMQPYLGKIIPRLYRYKYDPTPKIQNSMISIWDSIVSDPKEIVEQYYWEILREILDNLTFNEWRVRIACCLAVRDLLKRTNGLRLRSDENKVLYLREKLKESKEVNTSTQPSTSKAATSETTAMQMVGSLRLDDHVEEQSIPEPELKELWSQLFRVMDDIHEGTRLAAQGSVMALSKLCVTAASSDHGKSGSAVAASILPLLLETGVTHTVVDIRRVSIKTISEMIDSSGALIAPHLPSLIPCLLKATGELESTKLSYLSTRLGADQDAQDAVDSLRAEAAKSQTTMETINKCVRFTDYAALEKMTPAVLDIMKSTANLGTKIACAHFVCLISLRLAAEMTPLVSKYLGGCFSCLKDRNITVRKYYASAIGHLVGIAKENSIKNLFVKLDQLYMENDCSRAVGLTIQSINRRQPELLKDYLDNMIPLLFFAMHEQQTEENKPNIELWKDLWNEITPGDAGIRMHLPVLVNKMQQALIEDSWTRKTQAANAIQTIATRLTDTFPENERLHLLNLLLTALQGRTFQGKERLLEALAALCVGLNKQHEVCDRIIECALRECRKKEPQYRTLALAALGDILETLEADRFEEVYKMLWYLLEHKDYSSILSSDDEDNSNDADDAVKKELNSDERNRRATVLNKLQEAVCVALGKSWPKNSANTQHKFELQFAQKCTICLKNNTRPVQVSLMNALSKFIERLLVLDPNADLSLSAISEFTSQEKKPKVDKKENQSYITKQICVDVLQAVTYAAAIPHTGLKKETLNVMIVLLKRLNDAKDADNLSLVKKTWSETSNLFQKDSAPEIRCRIRDVEEKLNKI